MTYQKLGLFLAAVLGLVLPFSAWGEPRPASSRNRESAQGRDGKDKSEPVLDGTEIQVTYGNKGQTLTVHRGRIIAVRLPGNRAAGHSWQMTELTGKALKSLGKPSYVPNPDGQAPGGMPGAFIFKFEAVELGRSSLKMVYHNPEQEKKSFKKPNSFHVEFSVRKPPEKKKPG